jgi:lysozyme
MPLPKRARTGIAALCLSAAGLVGLVSYEGYTDTAVIPIPGDVPTIGFGTTEGVKLGDRTTPPKALKRALSSIYTYEGAIKQCVKVPLHQYEYDAAVQLSYNIGATAFCNSTVVRRFNALDYAGACDAFLMWDKAGGRVVAGLVNRRQSERRLCLGEGG